jgi:hypothetical protein
MKPKPRSATIFLMVPVATVTSNIPERGNRRSHGPFEKGDHAEHRHER